MVNFRDPAVEAMDNCEYGFIAAYGIWEHGEWIFFPKVILLKFWHVVDGLYMWVSLPRFCSYTASLTQGPPFQLGILHDSLL